jgi:hypothetical protein
MIYTWKEIKLPYIFERMIGFSLPLNKTFIVISYEGIHTINLNCEQIDIINDFDYPEGESIYDNQNNICIYNGVNYDILGLYGGESINKSNVGEQLIIWPQIEKFSLIDNNKGEQFSYKYNDLSGDWKILSFSYEFNYILLGLPYELRIFERIV